MGPWTFFHPYGPTPDEADGFGCGMFVLGFVSATLLWLWLS